ncbi:sensor histidine kinase [Prosthecomicrobium sp. N25]|uniref:sensor histidine kinase n=1 Tax=Prosthecomicrobium sp. N25 TaxID=3129254 RepID=UPI003076971E
MTIRSLRLRLAAGGTFAILVALAVAGLGMGLLFERHAARRLAEDLDVTLRQIAGGLVVAPDGTATLERPPADPRFGTPLSGLYWQIGTPAGELMRSRSLWDQQLDLPDDTPAEGSVDHHEVSGPDGARLIVAERLLRLGPEGRLRFRAAVAADKRTVQEDRDAFIADLVPGLGLLGLVLAAAGWAQIALGLKPLAWLRDAIARVRAGEARLVEGEVVEEVGPLVEELNGLIALRDREVEEAQRRAADLAHGLKTPLSALTGDAERLRGMGQTLIADQIEAVAVAMRRHVDRELARARPRPVRRGRAAGTPVAATLAPLIDTLRRTPDGERVDFAVDIPADAVAPFERDDLIEMTGNLVENAARHAAGMVRIRYAPGPGGGALTVEDDGPGIAEADRAKALERGGRLDETGPGSGLGLAIVRDVAGLYGHRLVLARSELGGLLARIEAGPAG